MTCACCLMCNKRRFGVLVSALLFICVATVVDAQPIATYNLSSGWATFGISVPQGVALDALRVGDLPTQTNVKTRWPDGSMRFAIVTAQVRSGGDYAITPGDSSSGSFRPSWPSASVEFGIGGETYVAVLPPYTDGDLWLSGPLVNEARVIVSPRASGGTHPLLQVIFDIRSYAGGGHRVDITTQNVKDTPGGGPVRYNVAVRINGGRPYSRGGVEHAYLTRWRKTFRLDLDESSVTPDFTPFYSSGAVPRFLNTIANPSHETPSDDRFEILTWGHLTRHMPTAGGRAEIGYYPFWTAQYLVHRSAGTRAYMLKHGDLSGSWSGHITEPDGITLPTLERYPNYWLDSRSIGRPNGPHTLNGTTDMMETAHMPSLAYVPYLITGDRYYLDQLKFWANFAIIATWPMDPNVPRTEKGLLWHNQVRGIAWGLRALGDAVVSMPDTDPQKAYLRAVLQHNLEQLDEHGRSDSGPLQLSFVGKMGTDTGGWGPGARLQTSPWMNGYVAWSLDHLADLGFAPVATLRDRIARAWVRLFTSEPEYERRFAGAYFLYAGAFTATGGIRYYDTMRELFCQTYGCDGMPGGGGHTPFAGYYGPEARAGLVLAVRLGIEGARDALNWLESQPGVMEDVNHRSGFAISLDSSTSTPARPTRPPVSGSRRPGAPRNPRIVP